MTSKVLLLLYFPEFWSSSPHSLIVILELSNILSIMWRIWNFLSSAKVSVYSWRVSRSSIFEASALRFQEGIVSVRRSRKAFFSRVPASVFSITITSTFSVHILNTDFQKLWNIFLNNWFWMWFGLALKYILYFTTDVYRWIKKLCLLPNRCLLGNRCYLYGALNVL